MPDLGAIRRWPAPAGAPASARARGSRRPVLLALTVLGLLGAGAGLRWASPPARPWSGRWWPGASTTVVTLYFQDGPFFVPVSRRLDARDDRPRAVLEALIAGPDDASGLRSAVPPGLRLRDVVVSDGVARVDLASSGRGPARDFTGAVTAIVNTLTTLPEVRAVELRVDGEGIGGLASRVPLLYYVGAYGLAAVPTEAVTPREALTAYLAGPPDARLLGLPRGVRLLRYQYVAADELVAVEFSYPESVRRLAFERPDEMRLVLVGLIATLTEFPEVAAVRLDFEGRARLGLGQCSDLLRTPQPRPRILNDERLLGRHGSGGRR